MNSNYTVRTIKKKNDASGEWERLQWKRLLWALMLFLTVLLGKKLYPETLLSAGDEIVNVISSSVELEKVFADLGASISEPDGILDEMTDFCIAVFGVRKEPEETTAQQAAFISPVFPDAKTGLLSPQTQFAALQEQREDDKQEACTPAVGTVLAVGPVLECDLPDGYTADKLSLGGLETVSPVLGRLNSGFGYRDHPISGRYSFHGGADISAVAGAPIAAFADGCVEYVGEDSSYGLYLQLDHGGGVKSFYAHCQSVSVEEGQLVKAGETVAAVGSSGSATGPHLHLELKCCGLRIDPAYYIELL